MAVLTGDALDVSFWHHIRERSAEWTSEVSAVLDIANGGNFEQGQALSAADIASIKERVAAHSGQLVSEVPLPFFVGPGPVMNFPDYVMEEA